MGFWRNLSLAAACAALVAPAIARHNERPAMTPEQKAAAEAELARYTSPTLTRFESDEDFRRYLGAVISAARARGQYWASSGQIQFAQAGQSDTVQPICPENDPNCAAPAEGQDVVITGSRIARPNITSVTPVTTVNSARAGQPANADITNTQMQGVDEGDIVKQIGHYLLVLQDGRIFVIDTRARGGRRLALSDRMNVYRDRNQHMWYDEMLVFGDRVLITGYSYGQQATELSVFRLDMGSGRLNRQGVFYMSSNDYYSATNYATRLVGNNLVVYTPFNLVDMTRPNFRWPMVRRWVDGEDRLAMDRRGRPLFDATQIHRPVRDTGQYPSVHTVSVCPLGEVGPSRELECRSSAFIGPNRAEWYVTEQDAYLWATDHDPRGARESACGAPPSFVADDYAPAILFRVPLNGAQPLVAATRGAPSDQFSLDARNGHFRALVQGRARDCRGGPVEWQLAFFDQPLNSFSRTLAEAPEQRYTAMPDVKSENIANRFTETHLVYGSIGATERGFAENSMPPAYVVPVNRPAGVRAISIRHTMLRAEQAGRDIVVTGYRNQQGLIVTLIDLDGRVPRVADQVLLDRRFEAEGRSHAFNSLIEADGSGVMGLPTIMREGWSSRAPWRSAASDLSFLTVDTRGRLRPVGELLRRFEYDGRSGGVPGYTCEVSCIDWYGNSRPIFTDGRVFGLTGTELIEGRIYGGEVHEVQRLNIALSKTPELASR